MNGSTIKHITKDIINNLELPIPETEEQIEYWVNYISEPYNKIEEIKTRLSTLETQVKTDIQDILDNNECEEVPLGELCEFEYGTRITKKNNLQNRYYVFISLYQ